MPVNHKGGSMLFIAGMMTGAIVTVLMLAVFSINKDEEM